MKPTFLFLMVICLRFEGKSQFIILPDSLYVDFCRNDSNRLVASRSDLNFKIVVTNLSMKPLKSYFALVYDDNRSPFGNYYWELYQKIGEEYRRVEISPSSSAAGSVHFQLLNELEDPGKADSAFAVYDLPKKDLMPSQSDTLTFNLLNDKIFLEPGEYGLVIYLRAGNFFVIYNALRRSFGRNYLPSNMYYFKVLKSLKVDFLNSSN